MLTLSERFSGTNVGMMLLYIVLWKDFNIQQLVSEQISARLSHQREWVIYMNIGQLF